MDTIIFHEGGFVEIYTAAGLIVLTDVEYARAKRRGSSVTWNRVINAITIIRQEIQTGDCNRGK